MKTATESVAGPRISAEQVAGFRLSRHHLATPATKASIARVAGDMCGAQAQVISAAALALRARIRGLRQEDVEKALWQDRVLAKTWCMRGTIHLIPSKEYSVFVRGTARREKRAEGWLTRHGLTAPIVDQLMEATGKALDRPLTRHELAKRIAASVGKHRKVHRSRGWGNRGPTDVVEIGGATLSVDAIVWLASARSLACWGPEAGDGPTHVRPDAWLPGMRETAPEEAETELVRHYLRAFGPATLREFAIWTAIGVRAAQEVWGRIGSEIVPVQVDGKTGSVLRRDLPALRRAKLTGPTVRLLPYFDGFLLGNTERDHLVDARHYKEVYRPAGWIAAVVLVDGRVQGTWSYDRKGDRILVRVEPFRPLARAVREGVEAEAADVARFFDSRLELTIH